MRSIIHLVSLVLPLTVVLPGCDLFKPKPPDIEFADYSKGYASKVDFAQLEHKHPLTREDLGKITPANLATLDQEQIDQIYARLTAGPIPDGVFDGTILLPRGTSGKIRPAEIVGGLSGWLLQLKGMKLEGVGEGLWKGKVFSRDQRVLRNRIEDLAVFRKAGLIDVEPKKVSVDGKDQWLLFPAKLYCGQSLLDSRRESIVIDYLFSDEIEGYQEKPDFIAGRRGLKIRDEIRMVRPGLYLGRAYMDKVFVLNFVLENKDVQKREGEEFLQTGQVVEDCWMGTQQRITASK